MKQILISLIFIAAAISASAGPRVVGNGGDGVYMDGQLFLLDLVESGEHLKPYIGPDAVDAKTEQVLAKSLALIPVDGALLSRKIQDIAKLSGGLATAIVHAIRTYSWKIVSYDLKNVEDEDTVVSFPLHQIAIRKQNQILINAKLFSELNPDNQVALIIHEAIYALVTPVETEKGFRQSSSDARRAVQAVFQEKMTFDGLVSAVKRFGDDTPYLPITGPHGRVLEASGGKFSITPIHFAYTHAVGDIMSTRKFRAATERKVDLELIGQACTLARVEKFEHLAFRTHSREVIMTPGSLDEGASYLGWEISDSWNPTQEWRIKVGSAAECRAVLTREMKKKGVLK